MESVATTAMHDTWMFVELRRIQAIETINTVVTELILVMAATGWTFKQDERNLSFCWMYMSVRRLRRRYPCFHGVHSDDWRRVMRVKQPTPPKRRGRFENVI